MNSNNRNGIKYIIRKIEGISEVAVLTLIYYYFWRYFYRELSAFPYYGNGKIVLLGVYAILVFILFYYCDSFKFGYLKAADATVAQWIAVLIVNIITYFQLCLLSNHMLNPWPMVLLTVIDFLIAVVLVYFFTAIYHQTFVPKDMLMIYGNKQAITLKIKMDQRADKYHISKVISCEESMDILEKEILEHDAVIINDVPAEIRNDLMKFCYRHKARAYIVPKITDIINRGAEEICLFDTPLLLVRGYGPTIMQLAAKRLLDIILCLIALIPGAPIMLIVALAIKIEDHGPVFYRQKRVTMDEKVFEILKFRSMIVDAEKEGKSIPATDHDLRITKVGRVIRATRIDELPQVLNILNGDMSIVGPRPERVEHYEEYCSEIPEFAFRTKVKGGLTGYAQVYGKYNTSAYDKLRLDLMYIENYSFILDLKLILMTLQILIKPESTEGFDKVITVADVINQIEEENNFPREV